MKVEEWVEAQKSEWRPKPPEKIDSGNPGLDVYLKESAERKGEEKGENGKVERRNGGREKC